MAREESEIVIALHCSGAGAAQWRGLAAALGPDISLLAPEQFGCDRTGHWTGENAFRLADEAAPILRSIDETDRKVHLVGHSYGGGVALHLALARRHRIASLTLYEPSAFSLLEQFEDGAEAYGEIRRVADTVADGLVTGRYCEAAHIFTDYWGGVGAWQALRPSARAALIRWFPKAALDFSALFNEPTHWAEFAALTCPVLVMRGEHAPRPSRLIADRLASIIPAAKRAVIAGAGHMGPLTHADQVNALIVDHVLTASVALPAPQVMRDHVAAGAF